MNDPWMLIFGVIFIVWLLSIEFRLFKHLYVIKILDERLTDLLNDKFNSGGE